MLSHYGSTMPILSDMKSALHFGAGNIGRGFIGLLLYNSGFELSFADVNVSLIEQLNQLKAYKVETIEPHAKQFTVHIKQAYDINLDIETLLEAMAHVDLITTAVGPNILPKIAPLFAKAIERIAQNSLSTYTNIIACENVMGGSELLKTEIYKYLSPSAIEYADTWIGFPNSAVDRIVPLQDNPEPLLVKVEPYFEWIIDETKTKDKLDIKGAILTDKLDAYIERKLYLVNAGHAAIAYAGYRKSYASIYESLKDEAIYNHVRGQMLEAATLLVRKHGFKYEDLEVYTDKTLDRFSNPDITDSIYRVGRSPLRKLSQNDRFIKPLNELYQYNLESKHFEESILNALKYDYAFDEEAVQLQAKIHELGIKKTLIEVCGLDPDHSFIKRLSNT